MATMLGSLLVSLGLESGTFKSGLSEAQKEMRRTQKQFEKIGQGMQQFGTKLTVGVTAPLIGLGAVAVKGFVEQEKAIAQVNAALTSMGNVAGRTSAQLVASADAMEMRSLFDAEVILTQVTANLLTFGNVAGREFDRAQQAAIDMATRLGGEPQAAAIMLGKALNDPVKGISALTRVGVQFTEQQKAQIAAMQAAGNTAGAQGIILAEVERQFKGAAQAAADTTPWRQAEVAIGQAGDKIGAAILPIIPPVTDAIVSLATAFTNLSPPMQEGVLVFGAVAVAVGPVLVALGGLVSIAPAIGGAFGIIRIAALGLMANPAILAFALVVTGIYLAFQNWDKIKAIVSGMYLAVKLWLQDKLGAVFNWLRDKIKAVTGFFFDMYDAVVGNSYVPDMVTEIGVEFNKLQALMVDPAQKAAGGVKAAMRELAAETSSLLARLFPELEEARKKASEIALIEKASAKGLISEDTAASAKYRLGTEGLGKAKVGIIDPGPLTDTIDTTKIMIGDFAKDTETKTVRIAQSFAEMSRNVVSSLQGLANSIKGGDFLGILGGVLNIFSQLGGAGVFGKSIQANLNKPIPGFANGTNFAPGGLSLVGERGPELVNLPRGAGVMTNRELRGLGGGGHVTVGVDPRNGNITAFVNGQIAATAPMIASAGAGMAQAQMVNSARRRIR